MKRNSIIVLVIAVLVLSVSFAYTYTTGVATIGVISPTADIATGNSSSSQPNWSSITDNLSENTTCGQVPTGDLFDITPSPAYSGDLVLSVHLTNVGALMKAYQYLNMQVYTENSESANQTPNYQALTLQNGQVSFQMAGLSPSIGSWTQTTQGDFNSGTSNQVDTATIAGSVILDTFSDNVNDSFDDQTKIAASANVTFSSGQVSLTSNPGASANETIRPNAAGDETLITEQFPATGAHWDKVDETTSDGDSTYIQTASTEWQEDLFNLPAHTAPSGATINYVRVYMVARSLNTPSQVSAYTHIKTNGVEYNGTQTQVTTSYATYSHQWNTNPQTGSAWTWTEIDNLQAGVGLRRALGTGAGSGRYTRVTQVYVEVNYTEETYDSPGTVTSINLLNGEKVVSIDDFYYDVSAIPSGTSMRVQFSSDNATWYNSANVSGGWDTLSQGTANITLSSLDWSGDNFYYNMELISDGTDTPILDEIRIYFSSYYASGDLISSAFDSGEDTGVTWHNIAFTIAEPSTTNVQFQLRSAATEGGLSSATWYGPTGTGDYYTTSGAAINSVHDDDRWIQYKAYFSGPGDFTPQLDDITISYSTATSNYTIEIIGGGYCLTSDNTSEWGAGWTTTPEFYLEITQR